MSDPHVPADPQSLWQGQPAAGHTMSLDELRSHSRRLERRIGRRNLREYIAAAFVVPAFAWAAWAAPLPVMRVGSVLVVVATIFVVYHLHRHGAAWTMPADMGLTDCLAFLRGELERQRDLLRGVWKWYLLPFAPGMILIYLGPVLARPDLASRAVWPAAATLVFFVFIGELNRRVAKKIQAKIDALEGNV
jgi:hypothetical protein